jgi:hypothetical protein
MANNLAQEPVIRKTDLARLVVLEDRIASLKELLIERMKSAAESTRSAAEEIDRRLESMNAFREQLANERTEFLRREIYDREHKSLADKVSDIAMEYMKRDMYDREHDALAIRVGVIEDNYIRTETHESQHIELQRRIAALELTNSAAGGGRAVEQAMKAQRNWNISIIVAVLSSLAVVLLRFFTRT